MMIRTKPKKRTLKIILPVMAMLMCIAFLTAPVKAYAASNQPVAPPAVEAEIIGSLLRIRTTAGFFAVEAVYVNERRFNHRVDSALVIDVSQYLAAEQTIAVYAVDFAGNHSNTVLLSPPPPVLPPVPNNITPEGQGAVLDHLHSRDNIEFITIQTPAGNVFHLIIDHSRNNNNVYFLNPVTEWDLLHLAAEAELPVPIQIIEMPTITEPCPIPAVTEQPTATETPPPAKAPAKDEGGSRIGLYIFLLIGGGAAFGVIYYLKILKPKQEREMYGGAEDEEYEEGDGFEDVDAEENTDTKNDEEGAEKDD